MQLFGSTRVNLVQRCDHLEASLNELRTIRVAQIAASYGEKAGDEVDVIIAQARNLLLEMRYCVVENLSALEGNIMQMLCEAAAKRSDTR